MPQRVGIHIHTTDEDLGRTYITTRKRLAQSAFAVGELLEHLEAAHSGRQRIPGQVGDVGVELPETVSGRVVAHQTRAHDRAIGVDDPPAGLRDHAVVGFGVEQERPETLWLGRREGTETVWRDPGALSPEAARLAVVPAGHPQGYLDCFDLFVADSYAAIGGAAPDGLPTFADGARSARLIDAVLASARADGWVEVYEMAPLLEMRDIRKSFLGVEVLHGVGLDCNAGEIHAVVARERRRQVDAHEGARRRAPPRRGRGADRRRAGQLSHPVQAQAAGVAIIYQEFNLLPDRTVAENVFVNREPTRRGLVDIRAMERRTEELLNEVGEVSFGPRTLVRNLSTAQQQVVEIVKALSLDARILVLDEPTAALAEHEVEVLFTLLRRLRERGLGMVYISHRLREIFSICDRITVLKDGEHVATLPVGEVDTGKLISLMVGRELDGLLPAARHARGAR